MDTDTVTTSCLSVCLYYESEIIACADRSLCCNCVCTHLHWGDTSNYVPTPLQINIDIVFVPVYELIVKGPHPPCDSKYTNFICGFFSALTLVHHWSVIKTYSRIRTQLSPQIGPRCIHGKVSVTCFFLESWHWFFLPVFLARSSIYALPIVVAVSLSISHCGNFSLIPTPHCVVFCVLPVIILIMLTTVEFSPLCAAITSLVSVSECPRFRYIR